MSSIVPPNTLKALLRDGGSATGTMVAEFRQPSVMRLLANAGFTFALIDNEHGPFNIETIADLSRYARTCGVTPIVRVPEATYAHISQALDGGAQGIMLPRVTSVAQVEAVVDLMKYPPRGRRGSVLSRGHTDFRSGDVVEAMEAMDRETMLVVQVETTEALTDLDAIVSVPGVDAALVGPNDLSIAMGIPGQMDAPAFAAALDQVIASCRKAGVVPAVHFNDLERALFWAARGMRMVSIGSEAGHLVASGRQAATALAGAFGA